MQKKQEQVKDIFQKVAIKYDEIAFFKISARHVAEIVKAKQTKESLKILDVACGTGNVVLVCASCLKDAQFEAMDISDGMLAVAKENAQRQGIENICFTLQDITKLSLDRKYDVITCSYALFFLPDAVNVLRSLMLHLNESGTLIFTSFLDKAFSPTVNRLLPLLVKYGSPSAKEYDMNKWENLKHEADIERLCSEANVQNFEIQTKEIRYPLNLDEWWELLNNTGFSGMLMELSIENYEQVKVELFEALVENQDDEGFVELIADSYFAVIEA